MHPKTKGIQLKTQTVITAISAELCTPCEYVVAAASAIYISHDTLKIFDLN